MPLQLDCIGTAVKVVSVPTYPAYMRGLPALMVLLDEETGRARAIVNASTLTALRNAAGEYHPAPIYARQCWILWIHRLCPSNMPPMSVVAFSPGRQIEAHTHLHICAFPSLKS